MAERAFASPADVADLAATEGWRIAVNGEGDAVVFERWREHLDWLAMRAVWASPRRIPRLVADARAVAVEHGFGALMSPLIPAEFAKPYVRAGMRVAARILMLRRELSYADIMGLPPVAPEGTIMGQGGREDIGEALEIDRECFEPLWAYDRGLFERYLGNDRLVTVRDGSSGRLIGFALTGVAGEEGSIGRLAVEAPRRRTGVGTALLAEALRWLAWSGASYATLSTQIDNRAAQRLYAASGFRVLRGSLVGLTIGT